MTALPADLFNNANDLFLKVFVGPVGGTLTELNPSNKITSAAYAISPPIALTNGTVIYGGASGTPTASSVINMTGAPLLTKPVWDDIRVPLDLAPTINTDAKPTYTPFYSGSLLYAYDFAKGNRDKQLNFTAQIPHTYKAGTDLRPHIHWTVKTTVADALKSNVVWGLEYQIQSINGLFSKTVSTTVLGTCGVPAPYVHAINGLPSISGTGIKESAIIIGRVYRDGTGNASDTFVDAATIFEIDFHFEVEKMGTINEIPN